MAKGPMTHDQSVQFVKDILAGKPVRTMTDFQDVDERCRYMDVAELLNERAVIAKRLATALVDLFNVVEDDTGDLWPAKKLVSELNSMDRRVDDEMWERFNKAESERMHRKSAKRWGK